MTGTSALSWTLDVSFIPLFVTVLVRFVGEVEHGPAVAEVHVADDAEALFVAAFHGGLHVCGELIFQCHDSTSKHDHAWSHCDSHIRDECRNQLKVRPRMAAF